MALAAAVAVERTCGFDVPRSSPAFCAGACWTDLVERRRTVGVATGFVLVCFNFLPIYGNVYESAVYIKGL